MKQNIVFVYGTLMQDRANHNSYLSDGQFIDKAVLHGYALYDLGSYPGIVLDSRDSVVGEIYSIDPHVLARLDVLEGEGVLYLRKKVIVAQNTGERIKAWAYIWNGSISRRVKVETEQQPWKPENAKI
jgi:gamma-glutamylcyclotransferase (GGCT)/AIG2-like uncharacterized protein YtfP